MTLPLPPILRLLTPPDPGLVAALESARRNREHVRVINDANLKNRVGPFVVFNGVDYSLDEHAALRAVGALAGTVGWLE